MSLGGSDRTIKITRKVGITTATRLAASAAVRSVGNDVK